MKIAIDTLGCEHARSGFGAYILYFISNLPEKKENDDIELELFGSEIDRYTYTSGTELTYNSVAVKDNLKAERAWHKKKLHKLIKKSKYDVVIYPAIGKVLPSNFKDHTGIAIANSIISADLENESKSTKKKIIKGLKNVKKIISASQYIKEDLIKIGIEAEKIVVIHNGIDHKLFFPALDLDSELVEITPFAIKRPYFIYASTLSSPLKKHVELIKAFEIFKEKTGLAHRLVLAGNDGDYAEEIHKCAFESKYATDIFLTGFFPAENISKLYAGAEACVFPSVNEGVGLPILEAMACGIPVIASEKGALKEMGGTSAIYCDTEVPENIALAMEKIVSDKAMKEKMIFDGILWAGEFNWEKTVKATLELLNTLK
ncbi:MAG: glycosyltransferase family 4 protein [Treponema sp.]|nr:glycosyltransferase family 4 protein [Treponema sp.]